MKKLWQKIQDNKLLYSGMFCYFGDPRKGPEISTDYNPYENDDDEGDESIEEGGEKGAEKDPKSSKGIKIKTTAASSEDTASELQRPLKANQQNKTAQNTAKKARIAREKATKATNLNTAEKKLKDELGGEFFKLSEVTGLTNSKSEFAISIPENLNAFKDEDGNRIKPRVIIHFHGRQGNQYNNGHTQSVYEQVKKMRKNGEPVILITPQDNTQAQKWEDFNNTEAIKGIMKLTEDLTGEKINDISLSSFSGGYHGTSKFLDKLGRSTDPEAKRLYKSINNVGFCDSFYSNQSYADTVANWASFKPENRLSLYWSPGLAKEGKNMLLETVKAKFEEQRLEMDNINIQDDPYKGGHKLDGKHFAKFMEKAPVGPPGLNWPRRNLEKILTADQYYTELGKCKTTQQRRKLILAQFFAGAAKPESTQIDLENINGKKISFQITGPLKFGTAIVRPDAVTAQIIADAVGGSLPTPALFKKLYADNRIEKVPMWDGNQLLARANKLRVTAGLSPVTAFNKYQWIPRFNKYGRAPIGSLMTSVEWDRAHTEMQMEWMATKGINSKLYLGSGKTILARTKAEKMTFGGAHMAIWQSDKKAWGMKDDILEDIGNSPHSNIYRDYVQDMFIISPPIIDGKVVSMKDIQTNTKYADVKTAIIKHFGKPENRYATPTWAKKEVAKYKRTGYTETYTPSKLPSSTEEESTLLANTSTPAKSYSGGDSYIGGGSYRDGGGYHGGGGGGMSYASLPSGAPSAGAYTPAVYIPETESNTPEAEAPKEGSDSREYTYTINSTLFLGDEGSLNAEVGPGVIGIKRMSEKGETTISLMTKLNSFLQTFKGTGYINSVIQIGMNDLIKEGQQFEVDAIFKRLEAIWTTLASKGIKVYACTIPSFGAEGKVEEKRKKLNKKILASEIPYKVVNLDSVGDLSKLSVEDLSKVIGKQYLSSLEKGSRFSLKEKSKMYAPSQTPFTTIGDSIMVKVGPHLRAGKFVRLDHHSRKIKNKNGREMPEMVGQQTPYMLRILRKEIIPQLKGKAGPPTVVIEGGGNDILGRLGSDEKMTQVENKVKTNLGLMYKECLDAGLMVIAVTMPSFGQWIKKQYKGNQPEIDRHLKLWRNINEFIIAEVHKWNRQPDDQHKRIMCVRAHETIGTRLGNTKAEYFSKGDPLHPNSKGSKAIANRIFAAINEMKRGVSFQNWLPKGAVAPKDHNHGGETVLANGQEHEHVEGGETHLEPEPNNTGDADPNIVNKGNLSSEDMKNKGKWRSAARKLGFTDIRSAGLKHLPNQLVLDSQELLKKLRTQAKKSENPQWGPNKIVVYKGIRYLFQVTWHPPHNHLTTWHMGVEVWIEDPSKKKNLGLAL